MNKRKYEITVIESKNNLIFGRNKMNKVLSFDKTFTSIRKKIFKLEKDMESMIFNVSEIRKKLII